MDKEYKETEEGIIDIKDLVLDLWKKRVLILCSVIIIGISSILYTLSLTNEYTVVIHLTEVKKDQETSLSAVSSEQTFGFSLPGFGGGNGLSPEMNKAITLMKSWDFVDEFIRVNSLEVPLLAGMGWDEKSRKLILNSDKYNEDTGNWVNQDFDINEPSIRWELYKEFLDEMRIMGDKNTGVHQLMITSYSPDLALEWANKFYKLVNLKMRTKKLSILDNNIANLQKQISINSNVSIRERLYDIQSQQIKSKAIIEASPEFVLEPIGQALSPYERSFPKRTLLVVAITFIGSLLTIICILAYSIVMRRTEKL